MNVIINLGVLDTPGYVQIWLALSITGLRSDTIPACNAVKILPTKEPAEAQTGRRERIETSGSLA